MKVGSREQTAKRFVWCSIGFYLKLSRVCSGHFYCTGEQTDGLFTPLLGTNTLCTADQHSAKLDDVYCLTFFPCAKLGGGGDTSIAGLWKQL